MSEVESWVIQLINRLEVSDLDDIISDDGDSDLEVLDHDESGDEVVDDVEEDDDEFLVSTTCLISGTFGNLAT